MQENVAVSAAVGKAVSWTGLNQFSKPAALLQAQQDYSGLVVGYGFLHHPSVIVSL